MWLTAVVDIDYHPSDSGPVVSLPPGSCFECYSRNTDITVLHTLKLLYFNTTGFCKPSCALYFMTFQILYRGGKYTVTSNSLGHLCYKEISGPFPRRWLLLLLWSQLVFEATGMKFRPCICGASALPQNAFLSHLLRQVFMYLRLALKLLCLWGWSHVCAFQMLGLQTYATMPSLYGANNRTQTFMQSRQALCQLRHILVVLHFYFETLFR